MLEPPLFNSLISRMFYIPTQSPELADECFWKCLSERRKPGFGRILSRGVRIVEGSAILIMLLKTCASFVFAHRKGDWWGWFGVLRSGRLLG